MTSEKMDNPRFIMVGGCPPDLDKLDHPGGQVTATTGLADYARKNAIDLDIIDTTQSSFPPPKISDRLMNGIKRVARFIKLVRNGRYNGAIIFTGASISYLERAIMALICRSYGIKTLLFLRNGKPIFHIRQSKFWWLFYMVLAKVPNWVAAQGTPWHEFYKSLNVPDERIVTIRNWLPERFVSVLSENDKTPKKFSLKLSFLFVGWMIREKGVYELLNAFVGSDILKNQAILIFAGGGDQMDALVKIAEKKNVNSVRFLGWQSQNQVMELMKNSDILVLPSYLEGFPNVILEALAFGMPIIASDVGAVADTVRPDENGFLVKPRDVVSLREAMEASMNKPTLLPRMSAEGVKILEDLHNRDRNCKAVFDLFC